MVQIGVLCRVWMGQVKKLHDARWHFFNTIIYTCFYCQVQIPGELEQKLRRQIHLIVDNESFFFKLNDNPY